MKELATRGLENHEGYVNIGSQLGLSEKRGMHQRHAFHFRVANTGIQTTEWSETGFEAEITPPFRTA